MKRIRAKYFFLGLLAFPFICLPQGSDLCAQQQKLLGVIKKLHYAPPAFDKTTNREILELFLEKLDPSRIFFLRGDVEKMEQTAASAGEETVFCELYETAWPLYKKRMNQADSLMSILSIDKTLQYSSRDTAFFYAKAKPAFPADLRAMRRKLEKRIKAGVLLKVLRQKPGDESISAITEAKFKEQEPEERKKMVAREQKLFKRFKEDEDHVKKTVFSSLNDAICKRCDPHSDYFTRNDKENFEGSLSTEKMSFGFSISENAENELAIAHLAPGSPAWKCNELHKGDVLVSVKFPGRDEVDISYMDEEDFYNLMQAAASPKIQIKVRRQDNTFRTVDLEKAKVEAEENAFNGFVLSSDSVKLGYIPLPSFYTNFDDDGYLGCANDVAKEIIKLKAENIQGLILDLRNNGGGSMKEAMDLAGIFIDEGPLAFLKSRTGKPMTLKDINRGTMYDGPLLVLINNYSASASEFFSAAVQDYNRALLVGSTTYGKGTAQGIVPADSNLLFYKNKMNINTGYAKITMNKFYRITGITHQSTGIKPDIILPDVLDVISSTEKDQPFVLRADSVNKKIMYQPYPALPVSYLKQKSAERVQANERFKKVAGLKAEMQATWQKEYKMPLALEAARKYYGQLVAMQNKIEDALTDSLPTGLKVENHNYSRELMDFNEYKKEQNRRFVEQISNDIYIRESFLILKDLNIFNKN